MSIRQPGDLAKTAAGLYIDGPRFLRNVQIYRPYICPFGELMAAVPAGARVLDVGCGGGLFLGLLASEGTITDGLGIDTSESAIRLARQMTGRLPAGCHLDFEVRAVLDDWPARTFDAVSIIDVIHHVPPKNQKAVFDRASLAVGDNGLLIYKDMCKTPAWRAWTNRAHDLIMARQWVHYVHPQRVVQWAEEAGLAVVGTERINNFWYGHDLLVFRRGGP